MAMEVHCQQISTSAFDDQLPGTSGLRKKVARFLDTPHYVENFVQSTVEVVKGHCGAGQPIVLVVGGDGRYGVRDVCQTIAKICAANGISRLIFAKDGIMSTPAISNYVCKRPDVSGAFILTASHNPGGKDGGDFGIKFNMANGGAAPTSFTDKVYEKTKTISSYSICSDLSIDLTSVGQQQFVVHCANSTSDLKIDIVDGIADYVAMAKEIFDFASLKSYLSGHKIVLNSLHGVTGPYVEAIFHSELNVPKDCLMKTNILEDFGGLHPDPNLTYAKSLVDKLASDDTLSFGSAFDGDGDRIMILGRHAFFVTPGDVLAVIANNLHLIPYFKSKKITGFARSMPTSGAVDLVAKRKDVPCFETPTGWKYFASLLDADKICLCGEESFGCGSNHIREKDGIWTALAMLQILAARQTTVEALLKDHWSTFGRNFFARYDYEGCESEPCNRMIDHLAQFVTSNPTGQTFDSSGKIFKIKSADSYAYTDPVTGDSCSNQGIRIIFECGSRIVYRLSGTGSAGATVRVYVDAYEVDIEQIGRKTADILAPCIQLALKLARLAEFTGRDAPTVVT